MGQRGVRRIRDVAVLAVGRPRPQSSPPAPPPSPRSVVEAYIGGLEDYLALCKRDPGAYTTAAERMVAAIGEPELVDTRNDPQLARIFGNRVIRRYPAFREFYGMEEAIEQIKIQTRYLAKMQRTWLKRWPPSGNVQWLPATEAQGGAELVEQAMTFVQDP